MAVQEYYNSSVGYVTIWGEVKDQPDMVIVCDGSDYGDLSVINRSNLIKKEDSYTYKREQERAEEIKQITAKAQENFDKLADKIVNEAIKRLASRIRFNVAFGKNGEAAPYALMLSTELEKMIKEDGPKAVKGES